MPTALALLRPAGATELSPQIHITTQVAWQTHLGLNPGVESIDPGAGGRTAAATEWFALFCTSAVQTKIGIKCDDSNKGLSIRPRGDRHCSGQRENELLHAATANPMIRPREKSMIAAMMLWASRGNNKRTKITPLEGSSIRALESVCTSPRPQSSIQSLPKEDALFVFFSRTQTQSSKRDKKGTKSCSMLPAHASQGGRCQKC